MLEVAEGRRRARAFRPPRGMGLSRVILLAGGLALSSGLLHHHCGMEEEVW